MITLTYSVKWWCWSRTSPVSTPCTSLWGIMLLPLSRSILSPTLNNLIMTMIKSGSITMFDTMQARGPCSAVCLQFSWRRIFVYIFEKVWQLFVYIFLQNHSSFFTLLKKRHFSVYNVWQNDSCLFTMWIHLCKLDTTSRTTMQSQSMNRQPSVEELELCHLFAMISKAVTWSAREWSQDQRGQLIRSPFGLCAWYALLKGRGHLLT